MIITTSAFVFSTSSSSQSSSSSSLATAPPPPTKGSKKTPMSQSSVLQSFVAGSTSGTISCVLFQPLDLLKTRLQATSAQAFDGTNIKHIIRSKSILSTVSYVVQKENILALWKGLTPSLYRTVPGVGMYFGTLHIMKRSFRPEPSFYENLLLGFTARGLVGITLLPITVIKARFESGKFHYKTVPEALRLIWKLEGARGLFSGLAATIARDAPYSGMYLMFYSEGKRLVQSTSDDELGPATHFSCGLAAGLLASVVTHPADVTKTQLQLYPSRYNGTKHCVAVILKEHGLSGFFRGIVPRCLRRTLISALSWTVFEEIMRSLNVKT